VVKILLDELFVEGGRVQQQGHGIEKKDYSEVVERLVSLK
jgi:hypothetical protein